MAGDDQNGSPETLGRIALKQVRVSRAEAEARLREPSNTSPRKAANPMNRLVPYLDLFSRLSDEELARLAGTPTSAVESLRQQVEEVNRALGRFADLLPRLSDDELTRLTGATVKTVRFWRLSQPRHLQGDNRRRTNGDVATPGNGNQTSTQENVPVRRDAEISDLSSESSSWSQRRAVPEAWTDVADASPDDSSTFVIDTVE